MEKRGYIFRNGRGCHPQHGATKLDRRNLLKLIVRALTLKIYVRLFSNIILLMSVLSLSSLSSSPSLFLPLHLSGQTPPSLLFLLLSWPLISCFLLSILTQDWCALCRCLPLKNWQPTLLGTHIVLYHTLPLLRPFSYSFGTGENDRQALWFFDCLRITVLCDFQLELLHTEAWVKGHMTHRCKLCDTWKTPSYVPINEFSVRMWVIHAYVLQTKM